MPSSNTTNERKVRFMTYLMEQNKIEEKYREKLKSIEHSFDETTQKYRTEHHVKLQNMSLITTAEIQRIKKHAKEISHSAQQYQLLSQKIDAAKRSIEKTIIDKINDEYEEKLHQLQKWRTEQRLEAKEEVQQILSEFKKTAANTRLQRLQRMQETLPATTARST